MEKDSYKNSISIYFSSYQILFFLHNFNLIFHRYFTDVNILNTFQVTSQVKTKIVELYTRCVKSHYLFDRGSKYRENKK